MDELIFDYKRVEDVALRCRKEIGKKYGLKTGNRKQIQKAILAKMQELNTKKIIIFSHNTSDVMKPTNKKHSELAREYNHILAQYRHWLNTIRFLKRQFWSPYEAWDFDHWLRVHKSEVGDARENLNYYATKLRELKQQIKTINKTPIAL